MAQDVRSCEREEAIGNASSHCLDEVRDWLILDQIPNFGIGTLTKLQQHFDISPHNLLRCTPTELTHLGFNPAQVASITKPNMRLIDREFKWLLANKAHFIVYPGHTDFPDLLSEITRPPLVLFGWGNKALLKSSQIAVVGSRNPSHYGKSCAFELAQQLVQQGFCITSGMAMGVDANAHQGAISAGGRTVAVLGSGLENLYPKRNIQLAHQIIQNQGLILSEFRAHTKPLAHNFPRRNRVVSGLSIGVLVIEAALRSGSLITAKYALEQNREVFAIPGNINNPLNEGAHLLIKQGAKLVSNLEDILDEFQNVNSCVLKDSSKKCEKSVIESLATDKLLDSVDHDVTALDVVIQRSKMPIEVVLAQLLEYELRGLVTPVSGGYIKLRGK